MQLHLCGVRMKLANKEQLKRVYKLQQNCIPYAYIVDHLVPIEVLENQALLVKFDDGKGYGGGIVTG